MSDEPTIPTYEEVAAVLMESDTRIAASDAPSCVPNSPGYYAIWVANPDSLSSPFDAILKSRGHNLLYIGIATGSLHERLVGQELKHKRAATFFRSLGAILGFRPTAGSLLGKKNQTNYRFSKPDTQTIIKWASNNLMVQYCVSPKTKTEIERALIKAYLPLLNLDHNPEPSPELKRVRKECRDIACS